MKLTGLFKRGAACLCTAAILMGGVSAFALTPPFRTSLPRQSFL